MAYAILRIKKLKTAGSVQAVGQHNNRERKTLNANPEQPNRVLIERAVSSAAAPATGASEGAANTETGENWGPVWEAVQARIAEVDARIRKNGVLACEVFLGASPEFFRPRGGPACTWDEARLEAWTPATMDWLKREWGEKNIVSAILHLDETTPHIQAVVVPIDPDTGRMNATRWLDGRKALSEMQDRYAEAMRGIGLERGVRGSVAEHTEIRKWYGQLQQPVPEVPEPVVETPGVFVVTSKAKQEYVEQQAARIHAEQQPAISTLETQARERQMAVTQRREAEATNKRLAKELQAERAERKAREAQLQREKAGLLAERDALRAQLEQFRQVPLPEAVTWFDPEELEVAGVRIGKDAQGRERIYDRDHKVIGRNALDLVQKVHGCDSIGAAAAWIQVRQGELAAKRLIYTSSNVGALAAEAAPAVRAAQDPQQGMHAQRLERAQEQVEKRKPSTWEGVVAIFKRMQFDLSRFREAQGYLYRLWDTLCQRKDELYDPHQQPSTGQSGGPVSDIFRELERQEDAARLQRAQEAARAQHSYRGPRR